MGDMDSGNSGSLQSSSGGDEDYESSRGGVAPDSLSSFFNHHQHHQSYPPAGRHVTTLPSFNPPPPPPPSFFDPLTSYLDHLSRSTNPNPVLNQDPVWPKGTAVLRSDHLVPSTSALDTSQPTAGAGGRNPRKRTRASRRAPTTVLTTDTNNFRAMVQEFTGIPAPPFGSGGPASSSSIFSPRTRLDLFGGGGMDSPATTIPPYLLRPLAQKIPPPPLASAINTTRSDVMTASSSCGNNNNNSYQMLTNLSFAPSYPPGNPDPGPGKPGSGGSLELPITTSACRNDDVDVDVHGHQLGGLTASFVTTGDAVNSSSGKGNGGQLDWAEGLGLGADGGAGVPAAPSSRSNAHHSHHRPQNLGFAAHQRIG